MSTSISSDEKFEAVITSYQSLSAQNEMMIRKIKEFSRCDEEFKSQNDYWRKQLGAVLKQKQKMCEKPPQPDFGRQEPVASHTLDSSSDGGPLRMVRPEVRIQANSTNFKVEIHKFEGKLDPDEFLDWRHIVEYVFEYKDVPEDKKVKLMALRLRKYASLWWTNLCAKRVRERKTKIGTWEKIKAKLNTRFQHPTYVQDYYSQLQTWCKEA